MSPNHLSVVASNVERGSPTIELALPTSLISLARPPTSFSHPRSTVDQSSKLKLGHQTVKEPDFKLSSPPSYPLAFLLSLHLSSPYRYQPRYQQLSSQIAGSIYGCRFHHRRGADPLCRSLRPCFLNGYRSLPRRTSPLPHQLPLSPPPLHRWGLELCSRPLSRFSRTRWKRSRENRDGRDGNVPLPL